MAAPQEPGYAEVRETHSGAVVLLGDRALKVKKPVDLGFLDFTERARRWAVCRREATLNARLAPDVYLGVGRWCVPGEPDEPFVAMRRMPDAARLSTLVREGGAGEDDVRLIARTLASFHAAAERGPAISRAGTRDAISGRWEESFAQSRGLPGDVVGRERLERVERLVRSYLAGREPLFAHRVAAGHVVDGHGDLLADDIFCLEDGPRILDCLEFDDELRHVDQVDDVAFLAMDLEHLGSPALAEALVHHYLDFSGETTPTSLLHHFVAYRAFVRAKVSWFRSVQPGAGAGVATEAGLLADLTERHLERGAVHLVLVGGPPGVGKSTLAGAVADELGMVVLSSDRVRKELAGLDPGAPAPEPLAHGLYSPDRTARTYRELCDRAARLLRMGESVVLDASWTSDAHRRAAREVADRTASLLTGLRCDLDAAVAERRILARQGAAATTGPVSDADPAIARALREAADPWPDAVRIDMRADPGSAATAACHAVRPGRSRPLVHRRRPHPTTREEGGPG